MVDETSILKSGWVIIGQQARAAFDKYIDLLAIDASGSVIIIELKRHKTPRDVVAQAIDYASWIVDIKLAGFNASCKSIAVVGSANLKLLNQSQSDYFKCFDPIDLLE